MVTALLLATPLHARPPQVLGGRVVNGTFNGRPVSGQVVRLLRMGRDDRTVVASAETDSGGKFALKVPPPGDTYAVVVSYRGVEYVGRPFRPPLQAPAEEDVVVYEPTMDRPPIYLLYRVVLLDRIGVGALSVREVIAVMNPSLRTYVGRATPPIGRVTLALGIPDGAQEVSMLSESSPVFADGRLVDTTPLPPGLWEIRVAYLLRYTGTRATARWILEEETRSMDVFAPDQGVRLTSAQLQVKPAGVVRGQRFLRVAGGELRRGQVVEVAFSNLPAHYTPLVPWLAGLLAVSLLVSLLRSVRISRRPRVNSPEAG